MSSLDGLPLTLFGFLGILIFYLCMSTGALVFQSHGRGLRLKNFKRCAEVVLICYRLLLCLL
uniref:Uncharacterized protein n=1 Tax=Microviridae sp. ctCoW18 TaxID=2826730 RepID=A0A8S5NQS9_9VIRU|nr:MAG TPA: hypothetical protein [Microviridae sp. ctCoW18]